ncbi:c-type cytochrome biogenesis protein CcmI [Rhodobacteraceae bacterium 2CG4]|uniref:C-type cytochrome biogenesis protein CcmI n=1 Tax=Halovulum marinum TaxID=2662447 RepID=A0A6L5Z1A2_9RHOB|nr:c-type cytochrome biogenesis protein CcmI [Halovulum marinum]MSU89764.1 c-type cytochrome biogenesis protein CcmI [Halovulum marinum]
MIFWAVAAILGLIVAAVLTRAMLRPGAAAGRADRAARVYRAQLDEVEADLARGTLTEAEAGALRAEVSRRLLAATDRADAGDAAAPGRMNLVAAALTAAFVLGGGGALYAVLGDAGAPDRPLARRLAEAAQAWAERPGQAEAEAQLAAAGRADPPEADPEQLALIERLQAALADRPTDERGHRLLAASLARLGRFPQAAEAQTRVLEIVGADATAADLVNLAEFRILAAQGYVSPEAEAALVAALDLDPQHPRARYFSGFGALQAGRPDIAYGLWARLLAESAPDAPWVAPIAAQMPEVARAAGQPVPPLPGSTATGPTQDDIAAAQDLSPEDRAQMIRGMVDRLSGRLATEGGPAEDWAQLIRALGVLGERGQANDVYREARTIFASAPRDLALIERAARDAEIVR